MGAFAGVILDVDGTLVDSNDAHACAWVQALQEHGISRPFGQLRRLIGMGGDKLLPAIADIEAESDVGKEISQRRGAIFHSMYLPLLQPTNGAQEMLRRLSRLGLKLVVASSATADELKKLLSICHADALISVRVSSDDADKSKPDPDIVNAALRKVQLPPEAAVMIGDTPYDIRAAQDAGVRTIAFRCGGWSDQHLAGALAIYDDPADLLRHFIESPLGRRATAEN